MPNIRVVKKFSFEEKTNIIKSASRKTKEINRDVTQKQVYLVKGETA